MMSGKISAYMGDDQFRAMISEIWTTICSKSGRREQLPQPHFSAAEIASMRARTRTEIVDHLKFRWGIAEDTAMNKKIVEEKTGAHVLPAWQVPPEDQAEQLGLL